MNHVPTAPFAPAPLLFLEPPESEFFMFLEEAHRLVAKNPTILDAIDADLDLHGQRKKAMRIQDVQWNEAKTQPLPTIDRLPANVVAESLILGAGRPRTNAYVVYLFLVGRGFLGGFKSADATTLVLESVTLLVFLANQNLWLPKGNTITELVNAVSSETREKIFDAQLSVVLKEGWDGGKMMMQDSTPVEGNVLWPTDSQLMVDLVARLAAWWKTRRRGTTEFQRTPGCQEAGQDVIVGPRDQPWDGPKEAGPSPEPL
ncbi:MAG: hypothetical protein WA705_06130 [Candidatus Ozemobacteraceae bacterium]